MLFTSICLLGIIVPAWGDTWTDSTGQFRTEAEFVKLENGVVQLRLANGMTIGVPLQKLGRVDQEKAKRLAASQRPAAPVKPKVAPEPKVTPPAAQDSLPSPDDSAAKELLSQLEVKAKPMWGQAGRVDNKGNKLPPNLFLAIEVTGKPAEEATHFGEVAMSQATADGKELERKMAFFERKDISRAFEKVNRRDIFARHPANGVRVPVEYKYPGAKLKLATYSGVLKLKTGGKTTLVSLGNLAKADGSMISNPHFEAAGITCKLTARRNSVTMLLKGELAQIRNILVANKEGKQHERYTGGGSGGSDDDYEYLYDFKDGVPEDASIDLTLRTDTIDVEVPFDFRDVKISAWTMATLSK